jgi:hypothetical protein
MLARCAQWPVNGSHFETHSAHASDVDILLLLLFLLPAGVLRCWHAVLSGQ